MDIPGYYYDAEKGRYFRVESSRTAPEGAAWSTHNVKKRKTHDEDAAVAQRRLEQTKDRIKRVMGSTEPLTRGAFERECGGGGVLTGDLQATCFAQGLKNKGAIFTAEGIGEPRPLEVTRMYIGGQDHRTGLCTVISVINKTDILSAYIARGKNNRLDSRQLHNYRLNNRGSLQSYREGNQELITDIQYHEPSNRILVAARQPYHGANSALFTFSPRIDTENDSPSHPYWQLPCGQFRNLTVPREYPGYAEYEHLCAVPGSENSPIPFAIGTNLGVMKWEPQNELIWLTPVNRMAGGRFSLPANHLFRDVYAVDFDPSERAVIFGGRPGALFNADMREDFRSWSYLRLPSAIAHLRCLSNGYHILAAGLKNQLGVYDLRFAASHRVSAYGDARIDIDDEQGKSGGGGGDGGGSSWRRSQKAGIGKARNDQFRTHGIAKPVIQFEQYRNGPHFDIGFAFDPMTGVVAAAYDSAPGTVALYSVRTGERLRVLNTATDEVKVSRIVKTIKFQTFPGDQTPTLFVGGGARGAITAFSFGVENVEDVL